MTRDHVRRFADRASYTIMVFALGVSTAQHDWPWAAFLLVASVFWGLTLLTDDRGGRS